MAVNKVIYGNTTLVDLTSDTVTADNMAKGVRATGADGTKIVGLLPKVAIDNELSLTSTNPVQNKVVYEVLSAVRENLLTQINNLSAVAKSGSYNDLTDKPSNATTSSAGLMSAADKSKLDGISSDSGNVKMIVYS